MGVADDDAFVRGQSVRLDDQRQPLREHVMLVEVCRGKGGRTGGWNAMTVKKILGEGFRALEPRGVARRTKAAPVGRDEAVDNAGDQRSFGADDSEVDILGDGKLKQRFNIIRGDLDV